MKKNLKSKKIKKAVRKAPTRLELSVYRKFANILTTIAEMSISSDEKKMLMNLAEMNHKVVCSSLGIRRI